MLTPWSEAIQPAHRQDAWIHWARHLIDVRGFQIECLLQHLLEALVGPGHNLKPDCVASQALAERRFFDSPDYPEHRMLHHPNSTE